jgi:hypothetical protein
MCVCIYIHTHTHTHTHTCTCSFRWKEVSLSYTLQHRLQYFPCISEEALFVVEYGTSSELHAYNTNYYLINLMCSMSVHYIIQKHLCPTNAQREFYYQS